MSAEADGRPSEGGVKPPPGARERLSSRFVEPRYKTVGSVNPAKIRGTFQTIAGLLHEIGADTIRAEGQNPEAPLNGHLATIHHTAFLTQFDVCKDHFIKWVLAATGEMEEEPQAPSLQEVEELCTRLTKRSRVEKSED
jgi:hypothetical protein